MTFQVRVHDAQRREQPRAGDCARNIRKREHDAEVGTYSRWLSRRDDDPRYVHYTTFYFSTDMTKRCGMIYILTSTKASSRKRRSQSSVSSSALLSRMAAKARCRRMSSVLSYVRVPSIWTMCQP